MMASLIKKKKYNVSYPSELQKRFPFTTSCPVTIPGYNYKFLYRVCDKTFSCVTEGVNDVRRPLDTKTHKENARKTKS